MDKIRRISKQNKILVVTALFVIGLLFVLPIALIKNSETMKRSSVIDGENDLKSQVLVYGKDYQLHYEKEQEIKEKMEKRAEILEKKHEEEKKLDVPPKTAQEVLEKINEEQGKIENNDKKDNNSKDENAGKDPQDKPSGGEGGSTGGDKPSQGEDNPPEDDDDFDNMDNIKHWEGDPNKPPPANVDKDMITPWDPKITTNLINRSNYAGCVANFRIDYKKYDGSYFRFPGKLRVYLNGSEVYGDVEQRDPGGEYGYGKARNYNLDLKEGKNYVVIIARDEDGFYSEKRFIIYGKKDLKLQEDEYVSFTFSFDLSNIGKGVPIPKQTFKVRKGTVVSKAVVDILTSKGYIVKYDGVTDAAGFYLWGLEKTGITSGWSLTQAQIDWLRGMSSLNWDYDNDRPEALNPNALYHKEIARWSGYMWYLNGQYVNYGLSQTALQEGDIVYFWWTNHMGEDLPGTHN